MKPRLLAFLIISMLLGLVSNGSRAQPLQAVVNISITVVKNEENSANAVLPICLKPEQPLNQVLDQEYVVAVIERAKKVITNYNLQIYKGLIFLKILVEKSQAIDTGSHKELKDYEEVKDYIEHIRLVDEYLRPQFYAYTLNGSIKVYDLLCAIENKSKNLEIQQEDIEQLLTMIERLEKEKVLIMELSAIIKNEQESFDKKIELIADGAEIE